MESLGDKEQEKTLEVEIERLLPGGVGLAHAEGLTIFVSLAAPGDVVRVEIERTRGKVAFASVREIIKPSRVRVEPPCPYFGLCGGCDFQQLSYEAQLNAKVEIIRDCLHRIGGIEPLPDITIQPSPKLWQYRARANWQVDALRGRLGYFARGSNEVCDVEYCAVLVPELQLTLEQVRDKLRAGAETTQLKNIEAVAGEEVVSVARVAPVANGNLGPGGVKSPHVSRRIGDETYFFSAEAFFQINHEMLEPLIAEAVRHTMGQASGEASTGGDAKENSGTARPTSSSVAIDLYCGVGLFTLPLARRFDRVVGVESNPKATEFARRNLEHAKLENAEVVTSRVGDWLQQHSRSFGRVEFLLLDPPRTGAENRDIAGILALRPREISYVSCDPATLARDLKKLIGAGYSLDSLVAFDMFPQTHHVETVVRLTG